MSIQITQPGGDQSIRREIDPADLIHDSKDGAQQTNDATAPTGVSWKEEVRDQQGNRYFAVYQFDAEEEATAGENPEDLPWDDEHIDRLEIIED